MEVRGSTKVVGIFGCPVSHSLSPRIHNFAFSRLNLDYVYVPFHVKPDQIGSAVQAIRSLNLAGVNVTIPHKETILEHLDEVSPLARDIGAVNTVLNRRGKLIGHNTDSPGFLTSLKGDGGFDPNNKRAVILGAGGTARAISVSLLEAGVRSLVIINRTLSRARDLVSQLKKISRKEEIREASFTSESLKDELKNCDLLINATPSGMEPSVFPFSPEKYMTSEHFVFDAVYSRTTPLLLSAQRAGARTLGGLGMLICQGALSFSLWTGAEPPFSVMREAMQEDA